MVAGTAALGAVALAASGWRVQWGYGGSYGGYPLQSSLNAYNLGYGNTLGIGLVPPAYVGTGTAGIGPIGIGGTNPLFGLGLSPLAIHNAVAEQSLRQRYPANYRLLPGLRRQRGPDPAVQQHHHPQRVTNTTIPNAVSTVPAERSVTGPDPPQSLRLAGAGSTPCRPIPRSGHPDCGQFGLPS